MQKMPGATLEHGQFVLNSGMWQKKQLNNEDGPQYLCFCLPLPKAGSQGILNRVARLVGSLTRLGVSRMFWHFGNPVAMSMI